MTKKQMVKEAVLKSLRSPQWKSMYSLKRLFQDTGYFPPKQSVSDSTIRRVVDELYKEGVIECKWACTYPRFYLIYTLKDKESAGV